jgi:predicted nucleotidyltransferase
MKLVEGLEASLRRRVDVVTERSLNKHIQPHVARDLTTIYEG